MTNHGLYKISDDFKFVEYLNSKNKKKTFKVEDNDDIEFLKTLEKEKDENKGLNMLYHYLDTRKLINDGNVIKLKKMSLNTPLSKNPAARLRELEILKEDLTTAKKQKQTRWKELKEKKDNEKLYNDDEINEYNQLIVEVKNINEQIQKINSEISTLNIDSVENVNINTAKNVNIKDKNLLTSLEQVLKTNLKDLAPEYIKIIKQSLNAEERNELDKEMEKEQNINMLDFIQKNDYQIDEIKKIQQQILSNLNNLAENKDLNDLNDKSKAILNFYYKDFLNIEDFDINDKTFDEYIKYCIDKKIPYEDNYFKLEDVNYLINKYFYPIVKKMFEKEEIFKNMSNAFIRVILETVDKVFTNNNNNNYTKIEFDTPYRISKVKSNEKYKYVYYSIYPIDGTTFNNSNIILRALGIYNTYSNSQPLKFLYKSFNKKFFLIFTEQEITEKVLNINLNWCFSKVNISGTKQTNANYYNIFLKQARSTQKFDSVDLKYFSSIENEKLEKILNTLNIIYDIKPQKEEEKTDENENNENENNENDIAEGLDDSLKNELRILNVEYKLNDLYDLIEGLKSEKNEDIEDDDKINELVAYFKDFYN